MIDHVSLEVRNLERSAAFYDAVLSTLGYRRLVERAMTVGFGKRYPEVWLNARPNGTPQSVGTGAHLCLRAADPASVRAFHDVAVEHGGKSEGAPGQRSAAMTSYFGAFVLDPDGNRLEAASFPAAGK